MAEQTVKYINLARSYVPMDPNSFPDSMHIADMKEEDRYPVMLYDGCNFMPTSYGYKSYFGVTQKLDINALGANVDAIFMFQTLQLENFLIALCDTGIWLKYGAEAGDWAQAITLDGIDTTVLHYQWSFAVIGNKLYCYRQNGDHLWSIESSSVDPGYVITELTPNFLNMSAQQGIFRAGDRLGFWDSANSIAWSNIDNFEDFTPDLETLAGNVIFPQIIGKIVNILGHGDGYVVYCTKSILYVQPIQNSLYLWKPTRILQDAGIAYSKECVAAVPDTLHYAYTSVGIFEIVNGTAQSIIPEAADFFRLTPTPKYLRIIEGRHLFIPIMDESFSVGFAQYSSGSIPPVTITFPTTDLGDLMAGIDAETYDIPLCSVIKGIEAGTFLDENQPTDPYNRQDWGTVTNSWVVEAAGIDITGYPYLQLYKADTMELLDQVNLEPTEGAFSYSVTANYSGNVYVAWHVASANTVAITVTLNGIIKAVVTAGPYEYGAETYTL